jgi:hypothetical protein
LMTPGRTTTVDAPAAPAPMIAKRGERSGARYSTIAYSGLLS